MIDRSEAKVLWFNTMQIPGPVCPSICYESFDAITFQALRRITPNFVLGACETKMRSSGLQRPSGKCFQRKKLNLFQELFFLPKSQH